MQRELAAVKAAKDFLQRERVACTSLLVTEKIFRSAAEGKADSAAEQVAAMQKELVAEKAANKVLADAAAAAEQQAAAAEQQVAAAEQQVAAMQKELDAKEDCTEVPKCSLEKGFAGQGTPDWWGHPDNWLNGKPDLKPCTATNNCFETSYASRYWGPDQIVCMASGQDGYGNRLP